MGSKIISFSLSSPEQKEAVSEYARNRGFKNAADLSRVALFEYIRRRPDKDAMTVVQQQQGV